MRDVNVGLGGRWLYDTDCFWPASFRAVGSGDCEDMALDIIVGYKWIVDPAHAAQNALQAAMKKALQEYCMMLQLGATSAMSLDAYGNAHARGKTASGQPSAYEAHAFIFMIPTNAVEKMSSEKPKEKLKITAPLRMADAQTELPTMILDGTSMRHPNPAFLDRLVSRRREVYGDGSPDKASSRDSQGFKDFMRNSWKGLDAKRVVFETSNFYKFSMSGFVPFGIVESKTGLAVHEVFYSSKGGRPDDPDDRDDPSKPQTVLGVEHKALDRADPNLVVIRAPYAASPRMIDFVAWFCENMMMQVPLLLDGSSHVSPFTKEEDLKAFVGQQTEIPAVPTATLSMFVGVHGVKWLKDNNKSVGDLTSSVKAHFGEGATVIAVAEWVSPSAHGVALHVLRGASPP